MRTFKNAKVVMLPTNEPSKLGDLATYKGYSLAKVIKEGINPKDSTLQFWNLYIISDDEIKENNTHFYNPHSGQLHISGNHTDYITINKNGCKKIIATTDTSLLIDTYINQGDTVKGDLIIKRGSDYTTGLKGRINLPQPSQQFIEKYIEEYNKGNVITDVLVEYELISNEEYFGNTVNPDNDVPYFDEKLKINPKDNTITIKKIKDSYSREEVIELLKDIASDANRDSDFSFNTNKWIEENL